MVNTIGNLTNAIGAIYNNQLFAVGLFNSSINSDIFYTWVEQLLIPELPDNSVIVMDNATFHMNEEFNKCLGDTYPSARRSDSEVADIQELIEEHGHTILWLPPYSPDLNPIDYASIALVLHSGEAVLRKAPRSGHG